MCALIMQMVVKTTKMQEALHGVLIPENAFQAFPLILDKRLEAIGISKVVRNPEQRGVFSGISVNISPLFID